MDNILKLVLGYFAAPSITAAIVLFVLKKYLGDRVDHYFEEKLTMFKHQLDLSTEAERFNYQRRIQEFNLYTVKRHENYLRLYELLLETESKILGIYGFRTELTYQEHNREDIRRVMTDARFPQGKIEEILAIWENREKSEAVKEMKRFFRLIEMKQADNSFIALKNHYIVCKLYLSNLVDTKLDAVITALGDLLSNYETVEQIPSEIRRGNSSLIDEGRKIRKTIHPQIEELTVQIKKELSVGYDS